MTNPLLFLDGPPDFHAIEPAHIVPAIETLLAQAGAALARAAGPDVPADYDSLAAVLDVPVERLGLAWNVVTHLHGVADTPALRASYLACLPQVTAFYTALHGDVGLYRKYAAIAQDPALTQAQARAVALAMQSAQLSGSELTGARKQRFAEIAERRALLTQQFATNVLDATDRYACYVSAADMDGVPEDVFEATRKAAAADGRDGCKLNLQQATYSAVMRFATNRSLREKLYRAYVTRASEFGPREIDNTDVMRELLELRHEAAALLGMANHAEVSLTPKMADDPQQVLDFLHGLGGPARTAAARDMAQLRAFAHRTLKLDELAAWDVAFASERLRQAEYAFSQTEVKRYFDVETVLDGVLRLACRIADIDIVPAKLPVWHDSVRAYRVARRGDLLGVFYLDLFARQGKRSGAWVDGLQSRWRMGADLRTAIACLACNFTAPDEHGVATIGHDELITLFHEFGHNLHVLLCTVDVLGVSGFSGVEWDAVELPSQLMENFAWKWDVVGPLSAHVDDGSPLPRALFDRMRAARNFQSGLALLRQIEFALFDMTLHVRPATAGDVQGLLDTVRSDIAVTPTPAYNRFAHSFSHIFAGSYAAGYYSYLWAEVLSADAWAAFTEAGVLHQPTWDRFRMEVLEVGGSRPALESFTAFRGRPPSLDALLRQRAIGGSVPDAA
jgi:oligopeptidase A